MEDKDQNYYAELAKQASIEREKPVDEQDAELIQHINTEVYYKIKDYAYAYAREKWGTMCQAGNQEDLIHSMLIELWTNFYRYDGKHTLTTFAKPHLLHGGQTYIAHLFGKSAYENEVSNKVKKVQKRLLALGYNEEAVNDAKLLHEETDLSITQILQSLEIERKSQLQEFNPDVHYGGAYATPESEYEQQQADLRTHAMMSMLKPYERYIVEASAGLYGLNMTRYSNLGADPDFVELIVEAGLENLVTEGELCLKESDGSKNTDVHFKGEYVPEGDVKSLHELAKRHLAQTPEYQKIARERKNFAQKHFAGSVESFTIFRDANENYEVLDQVTTSVFA